MRQLTLRLTNLTTLPDGGPVEVTVSEGQSLDVGRDYGMGWVLPDPQRIVSGRHFELRWERGDWWLYDLSTNGTFLNGATTRMKSPHRLAPGDTLQLGLYMAQVHFVEVPDQPAQATPFGMGSGAFAGTADNRSGGGADIWSAFGTSGTGDSAPSASTTGGWGAPPQALPQSLPQSPLHGTRDAPDSRGFPTPPKAPGHAASPFSAPPAPSAPASQPHASQPSLPPRDRYAAPESESPFSTPAAPPSQPGATAPDRGARYGEDPARSPFGNGDGPFAATPAQHRPMPPDPTQTSFPPAPQAPHPGYAGHSAPPAGFDTQYAPASRSSSAQSGGALMDLICQGAGLPPGSLSAGDEADTAREIGQALRILAEDLAMLLQARAIAKQSVRSGQRTMIGREDNNPLKFMPGPDEALRTMFGPPRAGYMRGAAAIRQGFDDIKRHQHATHAAMQPALARLLDDLAPEAIESRAEKSLLASRKARAWEIYVQRWDAKIHANENGMLDVFLKYFAEAYDQQTRK